jgi:N-acylglucosamine-6-phosphate 2-epimerase
VIRVTSEIIERLRGGIVVSVQTPRSSSLHGPQFAAALAKAAEAGGATGIRADSPADVAAVVASVHLPVMGIYTIAAPGTRREITPTLETAMAIGLAGAQIISLDGTRWPGEGTAVRTLIRAIHEEIGVPVQVDVASLADGLAARMDGADLVGTSTTGYPPSGAEDSPDIDLVHMLALNLDCPVVAERHYTTLDQIRTAFDAGAFAVVVGSAIVDVAAATRRFASAACRDRGSAR